MSPTQTFADCIVLHVDPQAVAWLLGGAQSQVCQDAHVWAQRAVQGLLLLVAGQCCLQEGGDAGVWREQTKATVAEKPLSLHSIIMSDDRKDEFAENNVGCI